WPIAEFLYQPNDRRRHRPGRANLWHPARNRTVSSRRFTHLQYRRSKARAWPGALNGHQKHEKTSKNSTPKSLVRSWTTWTTSPPAILVDSANPCGTNSAAIGVTALATTGPSPNTTTTHS